MKIALFIASILVFSLILPGVVTHATAQGTNTPFLPIEPTVEDPDVCLLYTSDAADE